MSIHYLRMIPYGSEEIMATATGFIYENTEEFFMITNGHNLTGVNPEQTKKITSSAAFPVRIDSKAKIQVDENHFTLSEFFTIDLYEDEDYLVPIWYIHPDKGYLIDVVAIPLAKKKDVPAHVKLFPINKMYANSNFDPVVADDIFILGYPFDFKDRAELPVWKRGTIATEPFFDIDSLPKFYVDTASRSGMSGSPVIMRRSGLHGLQGTALTGSEIFGTIENFVGIYSGRIGADDEFKAQLGIVWRAEVIKEIISGKKISTTDFQKI